MRLSRQFQACLFFFTKKISRVKNTSQAKMNLQNKFKQTLTNKNNNFSCVLKLLRGWKPFVLCFVLLLRSRLFRKKNKQASNFFDNLIILYYWNLLTCSKIKLRQVRNLWNKSSRSRSCHLRSSRSRSSHQRRNQSQR